MTQSEPVLRLVEAVRVLLEEGRFGGLAQAASGKELRRLLGGP